MKKIWSLFVVALLLVSFSACEAGGEKNSEPNTDSNLQSSLSAGNPDTSGGAKTDSGTDKTDGDISSPGVYREFLEQKKTETPNLSYALRDLDGDGTDELLLLNGCVLTVYGWKNEVVLIDSQDFVTGTLQLYYSNKTQYPGIISYTVGGGMDHYSYWTVKDGKLTEEKICDKDYSGVFGEVGAVTAFTEDQTLVEEALNAEKQGQTISFASPQ